MRRRETLRLRFVWTLKGPSEELSKIRSHLTRRSTMKDVEQQKRFLRRTLNISAEFCQGGEIVRFEGIETFAIDFCHSIASVQPISKVNCHLENDSSTLVSLASEGEDQPQEFDIAQPRLDYRSNCLDHHFEFQRSESTTANTISSPLSLCWRDLPANRLKPLVSKDFRTWMKAPRPCNSSCPSKSERSTDEFRSAHRTYTVKN